MDVVKRNISQMHGKVDILTESGKGTTFVISLPLTLAIIDGIILAVGDTRYIAPIYSIVEFIKPQAQDFVSINNEIAMFKVHGALLPLIRPDTLFNVRTKYPIEEMTICVVDSGSGKACIAVDNILGQQQVVIKSLGEKLQNVKGIAGGTILGDGMVGLILDIDGIINKSRGM
jgi:two-component system chemotaxis sensor kinase CheA